jgi:MFS family permease
MSNPTSPGSAPSAVRGATDRPYMVALGAMVAGYYSVEFITNNVIPLTARHFTDSPFFIAAIVALNRLFGFIVQPYVSWKSDRIRTRFGRRRFFLLIGIPGTLASLLVVGAFPHLVPPEYHHDAMVLGLFFVANIALQAFVDMNWGSHEPLYADTFKHKVLGRAVAMRSWAINLVTLFMSGYALKLADRNEYYVYLCSAGCLVMSLAIAVFVVRDPEKPAPPPAEGYNPLSHLALIFRNADYARIAAIGGLGIMGNAAFMLYLSLLATRTLGLSRADFGVTLFVGPIVSFIVSLPAGYLVDRWGPKPVMAAGFLLFAANSAAMAYWLHDMGSLLLLLTIYAAALNFVQLPLTSMIFQYAAPEERGKVYGLFQFTRGVTAFIFSLCIGTAVQFSDSRDPVPLYPDDFKDIARLSAELRRPSTPLSFHLSAGLSERTTSLADALTQGEAGVVKPLKESLAADLNRRIATGPLSDPAWLAGVPLGHRAQALRARGVEGPAAVVVFNRTVLHDAYPELIARSVDFRVGYKIDIVIALAAFAVTLSTRRGRYADT